MSEERTTKLMQDLMNIINELDMYPNHFKRMRPIVRKIERRLKREEKTDYEMIVNLIGYFSSMVQEGHSDKGLCINDVTAFNHNLQEVLDD